VRAGRAIPIAFLAVSLLLLVPLSRKAYAQSKNTCLDCHSNLDGPLQVTTEKFAADIHAQKGLTCASCHGGDPTKDDADAMSKAAGFRGHIERTQVPELCGKCHGDAAYMRQYNPSLRTDQLAQYHISKHGQLLAKGDTHVAVCVDCHSVHDLRPPSDPRSTVNPVNVAKTCSNCHSDRDHMKAYNIKTDQFAGYSGSVHYEALAQRGDLSAPTCTTCHGNHGAAPPGVASVENVCSTCHVFQTQLFDGSPHKAAFTASGLPGCITCHSNHRIQHTGDSMIGTGPQAVCTNCHSQGDAGFAAADSMSRELIQLELALVKSEDILQQAEQSGMEVGQAKLDVSEARDYLTKSRVAIHSFAPAKLDAQIKNGLAITDKTYAAGVKALRERDFRREGLGVSVLTILVVLGGLFLTIRNIER